MPPNVKVPHVVQQAVKAVERDIKPAAKLMAEIFLNTWLGDASILHGEAEAAKAGLPRISKTSSGRASAPRAATKVASKKSDAIVIDAVILDEDCATCGNTRRVGLAGHEVSCPSCSRK